MSSYPLPVAVAFTGPRSLSAPYTAWAWGLVDSLPVTTQILVGCAPGADLMIRQAAPRARVYAVASGRFGSGRAAFARRSAQMIDDLINRHGPAVYLVALVSGPCPDGIAPGPSWTSGAVPSGTWSTVALAVGRGVPVVAIWCHPDRPSLPAWPLGAWRRVACPPWSCPPANRFLLQPAPAFMWVHTPGLL